MNDVDLILQLGENHLRCLCDLRSTEGLHVDYKLKQDTSHGKLGNDDKRIIAKSLSAFSNSAGGSIIYGIDASKKDGIDGAHSLHPISDIQIFKSEVEEYVSRCIDPTNPDIEIHSIPRLDVHPYDGSGYLIIVIPQSRRRPHMSLGPKDGHFWYRTNDTTQRMERYQIQDAFSLRTSPELKLSYSFQKAMNVGGFIARDRTTKSDDVGVGGRMTIEIENLGPTSARFPYVSITNMNGLNINPHGVNGWGKFLLDRVSSGSNFFQGGSDTIVHPGMNIPLMKVEFDILVRDGVVLLFGNPIEDGSIDIEYKIGCMDSPQYSEVLSITGEKVLDFYRQSLDKIGPALGKR